MAGGHPRHSHLRRLPAVWKIRFLPGEFEPGHREDAVRIAFGMFFVVVVEQIEGLGVDLPLGLSPVESVRHAGVEQGVRTCVSDEGARGPRIGRRP